MNITYEPALTFLDYALIEDLLQLSKEAEDSVEDRINLIFKEMLFATLSEHIQFMYDADHKSGIITYPHGLVYMGELKGGKWHGNGVLLNKSGTEQEGLFTDGRFVKGVIRYSFGAIYRGESRNGKWHGSGTFTLPNGTVIETPIKL